MRFRTLYRGNLGTYTVGEGKTLSLEVSQSNPWVRLVPSEGNRNSYIIQAGWKPNDPEADGRVQSAKLIVSDNKETDRSIQSKEETSACR